jgi:CubicO group peptidase (beta-lactamase class C family)
VTEIQPIDPSKLEVMADVLASRKTSSILIVKDDRLATEWYAPGSDPAQKRPVGALADVLVTGMSLLVALNDGRMSLEELASKFVPRWQDDPSKSRIRIVHLASHTSGIEDALGPEQWKEAFRGSGPDAFRVVFEEAPVVFLPGAIKAYSCPGIAALNYTVTASLMGTAQADVLTLLRKRIMRPIGVQDRGQLDTISRSCWMGWSFIQFAGASFTPRAIAQIGRFMLRQGKWNGMQLVTSSSISQMVPPLSGESAPGLFWWTNADRKWPSLPRDSFAGVGGGHQVLLVVPSLNLVVVRTGKSLSDGGDFWGTLEEYLFEPLMNALH